MRGGKQRRDTETGGEKGRVKEKYTETERGREGRGEERERRERGRIEGK